MLVKNFLALPNPVCVKMVRFIHFDLAVGAVREILDLLHNYDYLDLEVIFCKGQSLFTF